MTNFNISTIFISAQNTDAGAQPALYFGGGQFSRTFIRWHYRAYSTVVQLFRKRSQIRSFRNISENENLLVLIRPVTRGAKLKLKIFSPPWRNVKNVLDIV